MAGYQSPTKFGKLLCCKKIVLPLHPGYQNQIHVAQENNEGTECLYTSQTVLFVIHTNYNIECTEELVVQRKQVSMRTNAAVQLLCMLVTMNSPGHTDLVT